MASESASSPRGLEKATYIERLVEVFQVPFIYGSLFLACVFGPPGAFLLTYVHTSSMNEALSRTLYLFFGENIPYGQGVIALANIYAILFYFLYMIRYMRLRLVAAKSTLLPLLPEGEVTYHQVFSPVCHLRPPIIIGTILIILANLQTYPDPLTNYAAFAGSYTANLLFVYIWLLFWLLVVGTFLWVYFGSIRGLYKLGTKPLKLKFFREDKTLGTKPIGLLSLSFASIYIIGIGLAILMVIILLPHTTFPFFTGLVAILILIGIAFFFLPLYSVHKRMLEAKNREQESVRQQLSKVVEKRITSDSSMKELGEALDRLTTMIAIDITKEDLEAFPTWPVDAPIIGRLSTIIFSVIAILIANYVMLYLLRWK